MLHMHAYGTTEMQNYMFQIAQNASFFLPFFTVRNE